MNAPTPEPDPVELAADLVPFDGSDPNTVLHVRTLIATAVHEERTRQHKIQAAYLHQIATALAAEFMPLTNRVPDWRNIHAGLTTAAFTLDPPPHTHPSGTGRWAGCRACYLNLPEGD